MLNFCANNYLGLSNHPTLIAAAKKALARNDLKRAQRALLPLLSRAKIRPIDRLGLIPLALALLVRPPGIHRGAVGLVPALLGVAALSWLAAEGAGDGLERTRSVTLLAAGALAARAAAGLDQAGRRALVRGTIAIALCAVGSDLAGLPAEVGGFAGNTGKTSRGEFGLHVPGLKKRMPGLKKRRPGLKENQRIQRRSKEIKGSQRKSKEFNRE